MEIPSIHLPLPSSIKHDRKAVELGLNAKTFSSTNLGLDDHWEKSSDPPPPLSALSLVKLHKDTQGQHNTQFLLNSKQIPPTLKEVSFSLEFLSMFWPDKTKKTQTDRHKSKVEWWNSQWELNPREPMLHPNSHITSSRHWNSWWDLNPRGTLVRLEAIYYPQYLIQRRTLHQQQNKFSQDFLVPTSQSTPTLS